MYIYVCKCVYVHVYVYVHGSTYTCTKSTAECVHIFSHTFQYSNVVLSSRHHVGCWVLGILVHVPTLCHSNTAIAKAPGCIPRFQDSNIQSLLVYIPALQLVHVHSIVHLPRFQESNSPAVLYYSIEVLWTHVGYGTWTTAPTTWIMEFWKLE